MAETHASLRRQAHRGHEEKLRRYAHGGHLSAADERANKALVRKAIAEHEAHDHPGEAKTRLKLKHGGVVEGGRSKPRLDRARGGRAGKSKKHAKTNINVIVAPQGGSKPVPVPVPVGGAGAAPSAPMGPRAPMAAAAGMGAPPGMPPRPPVAAGVPGMMPRKSGGRVYARSGNAEAKPLAAGTHVSYKYRSGGGSGEVSGVVKPAKTAANITYAVKPDKKSRHPGEPALIHRRGKHLHRATGGRVDMESGAGGGEGRLEKIKDYGKDADVKEPGVKGSGHEKMKRGGRA